MGMLLGLIVVHLFSTTCSYVSLLSPKGIINHEVQSLISVRSSLVDPHGVLDNWDVDAVEPCRWTMITCSSESFVISISAPNQNLSGTLSSSIVNLAYLQTLLLQNNNISGPIPFEIGNLSLLQVLDLSYNSFSGQIPTSLASIKNLHHLRLNNNGLYGSVPMSFKNMTELRSIDLSYNNLSGPLPPFFAKMVSIEGNPLICESRKNCNRSRTISDPFNWNGTKGRPQIYKAVSAIVSCMVLCFGVLLASVWWRKTDNPKQILQDLHDKTHEDIGTRNLKRFQFKELNEATNNFSSTNILGGGGYGVVYKGKLQNGTTVAIKRLRYGGRAFTQFQTEFQTISLAVHRNLLRLHGICVTEKEKLLVHPYMSNGSVAARLKVKPALEWVARKRIAVGSARGLLHLHEQCKPKIIHRDVKAANILLDEFQEAVVGDFGLAKIVDHKDSYVTTDVRGTIGHIAPEYLSTGRFSEKTDVFSFGILLLELITCRGAHDLGKLVDQKQWGISDWVKKLCSERKLDMVIDKELEQNYDAIELEEMVQIALLCTHLKPSVRPNMADVVQMLEGSGVNVKWESSQTVYTRDEVKE